MEYPVCSECRFFSQYTDDEGWCHRYAPRPIVVAEIPVDAHPVWPLVHVTDGCGDYETRTYGPA